MPLFFALQGMLWVASCQLAAKAQQLPSLIDTVSQVDSVAVLPTPAIEDTLPRPAARFFLAGSDSLFVRSGVHAWPLPGVLVVGDSSKPNTVPIVRRVAQPRKGGSPLPMLALLGGLVLVAGVRSQRPQELAMTVKGPFSYVLTEQHLRDQPVLASTSGLALDFVFLFTLSLLGALGLARMGAFASSTLGNRMGMVLLGVAALLVLNMAVTRLVAWLMRRPDAVRSYNFHGNVFYRALGLVLLPLAMVALYAPEQWADRVLLLAAAIVAITMLARLLRMLRVGLQIIRVASWHFILYLCALEILPLLLLIKYFIHGQF